MTVLVLTSRQDVTADMVVAHLHDQGVPLVRFDPADLPGEAGLSAEYDRGDFLGHLSLSGRLVGMDGLRSIWVRRPGAPGAGVTEQRAWVAAESEQALYGVLRCTPARWMNHPDASARARYKPWQLGVAHSCGFAVPATLITTFPKAARQFARAYPDLVVKPVSGAHPGDPPLALPTTRITPDADFSGVAAGPTLLQQHIPKRADIRLTWVGGELFAARKAADPDEVDGRFTGGGDAWEPVQPPKRIARAVQAYTRTARLAYGAFDFAEADEDGTWWFLECNQGGQFGFVELATGQPISHAIAAWLAAERR